MDHSAVGCMDHGCGRGYVSPRVWIGALHFEPQPYVK